MRLKAKLLVLFVSVSLVTVVATGALAHRRAWDEQLSGIGEGLARQMTHLDFGLRALLTEVEADVRALSENDLLRSRDDAQFTSFLHADERTFVYSYTDLERQIIAVLDAHRRHHPYVNSVYMGRENGAFVRSHPRDRPTRYDPRERPWYVLGKANAGRVVRTAAYPSVTTNDINIGVITALVDDAGAVYGVLGMDVTLADLTEYIAGFELRPQGRVLLVDGAGTILAAPEPKWLGRHADEYAQGLAALTSEPPQSPNDLATLEVDGFRTYVFWQPSRVADWTIALLVSAKDLDREIGRSVIWTVVALASPLALLAILTLVGVNAFVLAPLRVLTRGADAIRRTGDLDRRIALRQQDEFGDLADTLNDMVAAVRASHDALRLTEAELRAAHQNLAHIIEFLPDATFVIDETLRVVAWNRACEAMTGVPKEALLGRGDGAYAEPFFGERRALLVDLLDSPDENAATGYVTLQRRDGVVMGEVFAPELRGGEGAYLWGAAAPLYDGEGHRRGAIQVLRDITEDKATERALRESERRYRELVERANSIILRWTTEGRVTFLNEFGQRFFGFNADEIVGRHVLGTIVPDTESSGRDLRQLIDAIRRDPHAHEQNVNENMQRDGARVWIAWTNSLERDERGEIVGILSVGSDVTERRRAQEALRDLNRRLEQRVAERTAELAVARDRAQEADRLKSAFLATMSHELRTPLNSIIGFTGILLQGLAGPLSAEQHKQLGMVQASARHLLALINDVLDISKIEAGELQVHPEPFDLPASISKTVALIAPMAERKGLDVRVNVDPALGTVVSDARRVEQVLLNLLNNAVKFTERGSVELTAAIETDGKAEVGGSRVVRLCVSDTGIGIKPDDLSKLFEPFRQIDTGLARQREGTGLGLAICRRLAELLGGSIGATSEWGAGSTFCFTLPL